MLWLMAVMGLFGQEPKHPNLKKKVEPAYTRAALDNGVQGAVLFHVVVGAKGKITEMELISPLGYGLDEEARKALAKWEFEPGRRNGVPVDWEATIEVNFRMMGREFDAAAERRRSDFNAAWATMLRSESKAEAKAVARKKLEELQEQEYAPALYVVGMWRVAGENGPKDEARGMEMIGLAAEKRYGPAVYEMALRRMQGLGLPVDAEKGLDEMRSAAILGAVQAQYYLGGMYEAGQGVAKDLVLARQNFRLCASQGVEQCQYKLGKLMLESEDQRDHVRLQAMAWLALAAEHHGPAAELLDREAARLNAKQLEAVKRLKGQLVRK